MLVDILEFRVIMIEIKVYTSEKGKIKSKTCKGPDGYSAVNNSEILEIIREYPDHDFVFINARTKANMTDECLVSILMQMESEKLTKDSDLVNIIKNGGYINYIKKLENE